MVSAGGWDVGLRALARRVAAIAAAAPAGAMPVLTQASGDGVQRPGDTLPEAKRRTAATPRRDDVAEEHVESWRLVTQSQQGDGNAFGLLYDRYAEAVYRYIYYRVGDRTLAEDFTSETFLRALRSIGHLSYQGRDVGAWFTTIARNIVFDHSKSARNRLEVVTGDPIETGEEVPSTESAVLANLTSQRLVAAVNRLSAEQRECIVLRFMQGLSVNETAEVMGKNAGAIKALQHRAVRKLAEYVTGNSQ
jgi:RNA polymerase sigma-70 factor (ECF subfamily)